MEILPGANEVFSTLENLVTQSRFSACSAQKASESFTERAYISLYLASSTKARVVHSAGTS
jgi:hypothetical protein